ncbi:NUDIX domain-containing protein [Enterococcus sp. PF-2]|jgi:8-oxo-dGTP diphosphatase|nr:NUDIX domain-containing protein [Enterococcus sp. CR-Ec1]MBO1122697.1 NUDIX domain-containing protein [Enterococcus casseliflavus]TPE04815.1 NUDIX domain-containing protein [Enterococcus sp. PF-3]TPE23354.1 NUDIX domain-containing protein [Enterococcus sp. PF-2]
MSAFLKGMRKMSNVTIFDLEKIAEEQLVFAVIISKYQEKFVYVKHKERDTLEIPGGKRELGESITECAARELKEETGAKHFTLEPLFIYGVEKDGETDYGLVFEAQITELEDELTSEIEAIYVRVKPPVSWTYPTIQPLLLAEYVKRTKQ